MLLPSPTPRRTDGAVQAAQPLDWGEAMAEAAGGEPLSAHMPFRRANGSLSSSSPHSPSDLLASKPPRPSRGAHPSKGAWRRASASSQELPGCRPARPHLLGSKRGAQLLHARRRGGGGLRRPLQARPLLPPKSPETSFCAPPLPGKSEAAGKEGRGRFPRGLP